MKKVEYLYSLIKQVDPKEAQYEEYITRITEVGCKLVFDLKKEKNKKAAQGVQEEEKNQIQEEQIEDQMDAPIPQEEDLENDPNIPIANAQVISPQMLASIPNLQEMLKTGKIPSI